MIPDVVPVDTEYGPAMLWYDDQSDPANPGWMLRYPDRHGDRLDEILDLDDCPTTEALDYALHFLAREGIGAGQKLTATRAAELAGVAASTWRAYVAREQAPAADAGRAWWETTVRRWLASRPGPGARTDLKGR